MALRLIIFLLVLFPALELAFLVWLGFQVGPWPPIGLVILSGTLGAWVGRHQGFAVLRQLQKDVQQKVPPAVRLVEGALVVTGAFLLVLPGVFSDVIGLFLLIPPTRRWLAPRLLTSVAARFGLKPPPVDLRPPEPEQPDRGTPAPGDRHFDHPVR